MTVLTSFEETKRVMSEVGSTADYGSRLQCYHSDRIYLRLCRPWIRVLGRMASFGRTYCTPARHLKIFEMRDVWFVRDKIPRVEVEFTESDQSSHETR